ncbi:MerR family transcriptional regulator [Desertibaculum subflavum]|uniref:MerR family transcriptional regulator n=1 Tax=Desertibaculum subflavum TaxID=2268458 RepID=UPI000E6604B4
MSTSAQFLSPSEAAARLGVSAKALRLYERRGLIKPIRTAAGWRAYGPAEMARAAEIAALRALGFSLAQVERVLRGDPQGLEPALAAHQAALEGRIRQLADTVLMVGALRTKIARGSVPTVDEIAQLARPQSDAGTAFDLPWPWGGERFELNEIRPVNYIVGPLGSGKTRLARAIAENLPGAEFIGLDRSADGGAKAQARMAADPALRSRVDQTLTWLIDDGAETSPALVALVVALASEAPATLVVDMVEQGLDQATQEALIAHLRQRGPEAPSLFLLTRSSAILDLAAVGHDEAIILCPANHSPPTRVAPNAGAPGYEAVATCLASPEVRARTAGLVAMRPQVA